MAKIKLVDVNVNNLLVYLNNADINEAQIIAFTKDKILCRAFPPDKQIIKYTTEDLSDILKFESLPKGFKLLKFPLIKLKKLKNTLNVFAIANVETVNGAISYEEDDDDENAIMGVTLELFTQTMKIPIKRAEPYLVEWMPDEAWDTWSNTENYIVKFDMDKQFVEKLTKLCRLEWDEGDETKDKTKSFALDIIKSKKNVLFRDKDKNGWKLGYDPKNDGEIDVRADQDMTFYVPKIVLDKMTSTEYTVYITKIEDNPMMIVYENEDNIIVKGLMDVE